MKIRTDFVSNSSSSSFMLVGCCYDDIDEFIKQLFVNEPVLVKQYERGELDISDEIDKRIKEPLTWRKSGWDNEIDQVAIGTTIYEMTGNETLNEFKTKVKHNLANCGLIVDLNKIDFISGGNDGNGSSWID